jgi:hypothetical protein
MAYTGGIVAATSAAEKRRQMQLAKFAQEEEEDLTTYTQDDLKEEWEFKIVRSDSAAFRDPETLKQLVEEEGQAGWVMLEKFDDSRVRFKRPRSARARDAYLPPGVDPYRTRYGPATAQRMLAMTTLVMLGLVVLGVMAFLFFESRAQGASASEDTVLIMPVIFIVIGLAIAGTVAAIKRRS